MKLQQAEAQTLTNDDHPIFIALQDVFNRYPIKLADFETVIEGMEDDLYPVRNQTWDEPSDRYGRSERQFEPAPRYQDFDRYPDRADDTRREEARYDDHYEERYDDRSDAASSARELLPLSLGSGDDGASK